MKKKKVQPKSAAAPQTESYIHSTRIFRWEKHHNVQDIWEHICMTCSILLLQSSILLLITVNLLEPDILECEVKQALESITTNKASGGDGIPVELYQILKDNAVKMLHSICQQIWKLVSGHRTGKCQFSFQSLRKAMPKNAQTTA